jgi:hypothetical protein
MVFRGYEPDTTGASQFEPPVATGEPLPDLGVSRTTARTTAPVSTMLSLPLCVLQRLAGVGFCAAVPEVDDRAVDRCGGPWVLPERFSKVTPTGTIGG